MGAVPAACCGKVDVVSEAIVVGQYASNGLPLKVSVVPSKDDTFALDSCENRSTSAETPDDDVGSNSTSNGENWSAEMTSVASHLKRAMRVDWKPGTVFHDITNRPSKDTPQIDAGALLKVHSAVRWGRSVEELRSLGLTNQIVANAVDENNGNIALHVAVQNGHLDIVRYLVEELQCGVNARNRAGNTPLHMGVEYDYYVINQILVNAGADYAIVNTEGHPAIQGISGSKFGKNAWNNPVTMMKTVDDDVNALDAVFTLLENWPTGDILKEDLVRVGLAKKKDLRVWKDGNFQPRFMRVVAKF